MAFYTMIGLIVVAAILGVGVYWMMLNITFKRQSVRYTYMKDEAGNEYVQDDSKDEQRAPKT
jgi:alpha-D-ribose 1-methylphosphonate 5-triphosphate synthase subunit PhnG